jgi:hypothetical protein
MNGAALLWITIFFCSVLMFFVIAAVAGVRGLMDLKELLKGARRSERG